MVKKISKKVVILHGSPRVSGNSDILAKKDQNMQEMKLKKFHFQ